MFGRFAHEQPHLVRQSPFPHLLVDLPSHTRGLWENSIASALIQLLARVSNLTMLQEWGLYSLTQGVEYENM